MLNVNWIGLSIPFAYIAVLVSSLITFSSVYRKRRAGQLKYQRDKRIADA